MYWRQPRSPCRVMALEHVMLEREITMNVSNARLPGVNAKTIWMSMTLFVVAVLLTENPDKITFLKQGADDNPGAPQ